MINEVVYNFMEAYCYYFKAFFRWLGFDTESPDFIFVVLLLIAGSCLVDLITDHLMEQAENE